VFAARAAHLIDNWPYAIASIVILGAGPVVATLRRPAPRTAAPDRSGEDVPLEWVGITRPFTPTDLAALDAGLAMPELDPRASA
jgi:hypothetical protein